MCITYYFYYIDSHLKARLFSAISIAGQFHCIIIYWHYRIQIGMEVENKDTGRKDWGLI